jgi:hypothetical protein
LRHHSGDFWLARFIPTLSNRSRKKNVALRVWRQRFHISFIDEVWSGEGSAPLPYRNEGLPE